MSHIVVIKIGGLASDNLTEDFFQTLNQWYAQGKQIVIVHGGGYFIEEMTKKLHLDSPIKNGLRITTEEILNITQMVLIGQVQPKIIQILHDNGLKTIGLNAGDNHLITGVFLNQSDLGYVGKVTNINTSLINFLLNNSFLPVIAPLAISAKGQWLNVNADDVASTVASHLQANELYLLTNVPGISVNGAWQSQLSKKECQSLLYQKAVSGGMIPKINSAISALQRGVKKVCITDSISHDGTLINLNEVKTDEQFIPKLSS